MEKSEQAFLTDTTTRVCVSVGTKGSGKTFLLLQYVKFALMSKRFASFHIVLPSFTNEEDGQYQWLTQQPNIYIYTSYSPVVTPRVIADAAKNFKAGHRTFFALDDATHNGVDLNSDHEFLELVTTSRHKKIQLWLIFHSLRAVIVPVIRANIDYLFVFKISNSKLLNALYEEYFSMFDEFLGRPRQFVGYYLKEVFNVEHGGLFLNTINTSYTAQVPKWQLISLQLPIKHANHPRPKQATASGTVTRRIKTANDRED